MDAADLFREYTPHLRRYFMRRYPSDGVDDLISETFERVVRNLPRYQDRGYPVLTWLYRVAHGRLVDALRYDRRRVHVYLDESPHVSVDGPEQAVEQREAQTWIRSQILTHLIRNQRQVIWLRFVKDLSLSETAQRLELSVEQVKALQFRGIAKLRIALASGDASPITIALAEAQAPRFRACQVPGCDHPVTGHGYCLVHYQRWRRRGTPDPMPKTCTVDGCDRTVKARARCERHYRQLMSAEKRARKEQSHV